MTDLAVIAPAFVEMAHRIVWCTVGTVSPAAEARTRVLHPIWEWDGTRLVGWIATSPLSLKRRDLDAHPQVSLTYWDPSQDTCTAECRAAWELDAGAKRAGWERFVQAPAPVGYDPSIIPGWTAPEDEAFGILRLEPYRMRLMPGSVLLAGTGEVLTWRA